MKENFNPIQGKRGEFRVALHLSELGDRAWEILSLSQEIGFEKPRFETHIRHSGAVEVWAIILQQFHQYDADPMVIVEPWDEQTHQLWEACGTDANLKIAILHNFAEYLELVA